MNSQTEEISQEELESWKAHKVTRVLYRNLRLWREGMKEGWAKGAYIGDTDFTSAKLSSGAIGQIFVIDELLDITADELNRGFQDEQVTN